MSSEYFSRPVPRTVLSEAVLRRMIKCCSALHCYTQVQGMDGGEAGTGTKKYGCLSMLIWSSVTRH